MHRSFSSLKQNVRNNGRQKDKYIIIARANPYLDGCNILVASSRARRGTEKLFIQMQSLTDEFMTFVLCQATATRPRSTQARKWSDWTFIDGLT